MLHCIRALSSLKDLRQLSFWIHKFHDKAVTQALVDFLRENNSVVELRYMSFFPGALKIFIRGLAKTNGLRKVHFSPSYSWEIFFGITDRSDAEALIASLKANTTLTEITDLHFNFGAAEEVAEGGSQRDERYYEKMMNFHLTLNRFGRPLFTNSRTSNALVGKILAFARNDANALYSFLREVPSLVRETEGRSRRSRRARKRLRYA